MEIEKEVDWAAENILAYERVLRLCQVVDQSEGISANQRDFRLGRGFRDNDVLLINHRFLDLLFAAHQQLKPGRRLRPHQL